MTPQMPPADGAAERPASPPRADPLLARRIEEASLNAWPALHQVLLDGWVLRFAGGFTKRANAVVPLYPSSRPVEDKIAYCERLYANQHLRPIFRLTDIDDAHTLDALLAARGYRHLDPTLVLWAPLPSTAVRAEIDADYEELDREGWLDLYTALAGMPPTTQHLHAALLKAIRTPCLYGALRTGAGHAACGLGVVEQDLVGLFDILTASDRRRRGHGERLIRALLARGCGAGAGAAYLQVLENNEPARALYAKLDFVPLYRYWYRIGP